MHAIGMR